MSFQEYHAKFLRLSSESAAWKLIKADNAPMILAFLSDVFEEEGEVPYGQVRVALDAELKRARELGLWESQTAAGSYLNQWIRAGWLRELDDRVSKTDACEVAIRFCRSLDRREASTTASHLRIVQEAVRDFAVAISTDPGARLALLNIRKAEIEKEIAETEAGVVRQLSDSEQRERIREIYQLASVLTSDFRLVEDEIREMDQEIRVQMIKSGANRGDILLSVLEKEQALAKTDAGAAFESFFQLLCDQNRSAELREQLRGILSESVGQHLTAPQRHFLGQLMRELTRESERIFNIRRRTQESLRSYVESGAVFENRAVDRLLGQLEQVAVEFRGAEMDLRTPTKINIPVGKVQITSPDAMRLRSPEEKLDTSSIEEEINSSSPDEAMLEYLDSIQLMDMASNIKALLRSDGPMSIGAISERQPIQAGLEELVSLIRVAKSIGATELDEKECVEVRDKQGERIEAMIPRYLLSADLFPDDIGELVI